MRCSVVAHSRNFCFLLRIPLNPLQIEYKDCVEDRDEKQRNEGRDGESADLGITERFPERATFEREREQSQDRCASRDHHGTNSLNSAIVKSTLQRRSLFV